MSRKIQPTWLAPCSTLATRINPGILPNAASDVSYVHQSSFICSNKQGVFLRRHQCSAVLFLGTEAASVATTRAPPSAALRLLLFWHLPGKRLLQWLPPVTPASSTSPPSKAPRLPPVAPTSRAPFPAAPALTLGYQPGSIAVRLHTMVASGGTRPCITSFQGIEAAFSDTLFPVVAIGSTALLSICFSSTEAASGVVTATFNPSLYGTKVTSYHRGLSCKTLSRPPQYAQDLPVLAARHLLLLRPLAMPSTIWYVRS